MSRRHGGWTDEQALDVYQDIESPTFLPPTEVRRGGNRRRYLLVVCKHCGRQSWQSLHGYRVRIGCGPKCKVYVPYPGAPVKQKNESSYNWDLLKFWPKQVTWSRANADF